MRTPKGWYIWNTGGNCTAFRRDLADARYVLITATTGPECPRRPTDTCVAGMYSVAGDLLRETVGPTRQMVAEGDKWVRISRESIAERARIVADASADAYSRDRYASWLGVARMLIARGYSNREAEAILRSKWTRWAADASPKAYGKVAAKDLAAWLDAQKTTLDQVRQLADETFPVEVAK